MSLFTDLKEILTPYANAIKGVANKIGILSNLTTNNKTDIVHAVNEVKADLGALEPGLSDTAKAALLACFTHVGWTDENGQDYYAALAAALETDIRQLPDAYTWLYDATEGDLLSEQNYVTVSSSGTYTETIINGQLVLNSQPIEEGGSNNFVRFSLSDDTSINARLSARVKFNDIPRTREGTPGAEGFRMQLSNGTNGAQVFFISQPLDNDNLGVSYFEGTNKRYVDLSDYDMSKYHIVEIKLANGAQTMYIDGNVIFTSNTLSSNYCTANAILNQRSGNDAHGAVTTIDWIAYNEVS